MRGRRDKQRPCGWELGVPSWGPRGLGPRALRVPSRGPRAASPKRSAPGQTALLAPHPTPVAPLPTPARLWSHPQATLTCKEVSPTRQLWKHDSLSISRPSSNPIFPAWFSFISPVDGPLSPPTDAAAQDPGDAQRPHQRRSHPRLMVACYGS